MLSQVQKIVNIKFAALKKVFLCDIILNRKNRKETEKMAYKREWQRPLELDRPTWDMLRENNIYTDSRRDFRWRHCPDKENGVIRVAVYTVMSYEHADDVVEQDFPLSPEGLAEANVWIESKFREFVDADPERY